MKSTGWKATAARVSALLLMLMLVSITKELKAQTFNVIHTFTGNADGAKPNAGLTMDRGGNLYGTASAGGAGYGTVFKLKHTNGSWVFTPLYSFQGGSDGAVPGAVVFGPNGSLYGATASGGEGACGGGCGTVFNLKPSVSACKAALCPWNEAVIYRFMGGTDGAVPGNCSTLVFDSANNIYGTTTQGGSNSLGTVYALTPSGGGLAENPIYSFTGGSDEGRPYSGVTFDNAGQNLYGTTAIGPHQGTVYELSPSASGWTENTIYSFQNGSDGASPLAGVVFDEMGNMYGATQTGGDGNGGTAFELTPSSGNWGFSLLYSFSGQPLGGVYCDLVMDNAGNLYGTTADDGINGWGSVFKLTPSGNGWTYTSLHDFTGGPDGGTAHSNVVIDTNGNLYGTTWRGGANHQGVVWEITP